MQAGTGPRVPGGRGTAPTRPRPARPRSRWKRRSSAPPRPSSLGRSTTDPRPEGANRSETASGTTSGEVASFAPWKVTTDKQTRQRQPNSQLQCGPALHDARQQRVCAMTRWKRPTGRPRRRVFEIMRDDQGVMAFGCGLRRGEIHRDHLDGPTESSTGGGGADGDRDGWRFHNDDRTAAFLRTEDFQDSHEATRGRLPMSRPAAAASRLATS